MSWEEELAKKVPVEKAYDVLLLRLQNKLALH